MTNSCNERAVKDLSSPTASIIIPVYNAERYIEACLASIQRQTLADFEVVCVDDGSTDASAALVSAIAAEDSRIRLVQQKNTGASSARNAGFDRASANYVTFVDADDEVSCDFLHVLVTALQSDRSNIALGNTHIVRGDGTKRPKYPEQENDALVRGSDHERYKLLSRNAPHGKLFRRSFLVEHGIRFYEGITYEDYHHWVQCVAQNPRISLRSHFVYIYKRNPHSISSGSRSLTPFNVNSRLVQTTESLRVARASAIPGLAEKTFRMQFRARLMRHITALGRTKDLVAAEFAFEQIRAGIQPHEVDIRSKLHGYVGLIYTLILQGSVEDLRKLVRWGEGKAPLALYLDSAPLVSRVYVAPDELPSIPKQPRELFDVSDKVRKK